MVRLPEESATTTYLLDISFPAALNRVRVALREANVAILKELDVARRIRQALLAEIPPCVVIFAWYPPASLEDGRPDAQCAALMPLHIVVSEGGSHTEVHFLRRPPREEPPFDALYIERLARLQAGISQALEKIGMRALNP